MKAFFLALILLHSAQVVESVLNKVMEEVHQRLSIHSEMVRASEVNYDVIFFGVKQYSQSEVLIWLIDAMKLAFNFFR